MMHCGLLGQKLSHSYSPAIHASLGDYEYKLYETEPGDVEAFLRGEIIRRDVPEREQKNEMTMQL